MSLLMQMMKSKAHCLDQFVLIVILHQKSKLQHLQNKKMSDPDSSIRVNRESVSNIAALILAIEKHDLRKTLLKPARN